MAPRSRRACSVGESVASLPLTVMPRASMIRAIADSPAPPMPTKCTRPSWSAGSSSSGTGTFIGRLQRPSVASRSSASRGTSRRGRGTHRRQPVGVGDQSRHGGRDPLRAHRPVGDEQPAPGVDDRAGVVLLLAVADRQRHEDGRQADRRGLGHRGGAGPADHEVGRGVGQVHPVDEGRRRRTGPRRCPATSPRTGGPTTCSTWTPAAASAGAAPDDRLVEPARALRAAGHQQRGAVGVEPEERAGLVATRGPVQARDHRADRQADVLRPRQRGVGEAHARPASATRAPDLVGQAGQRVLLVHDEGSRRRRAAR